VNLREVTKQAGGGKARKRVGRGTGSGCGKTCGRGHKGAGQRAGHRKRSLSSGGSTPLYLRLPKVGFSNFRFARNYHLVNIGDLEEVFEDGDRVTGDVLVQARLVRNLKLPVKVLGDGELNKKLTVEAQKFSKKAAARITAAGGEAITVPAIK
jgi:large subunit ribosomal protein L15